MRRFRKTRRSLAGLLLLAGCAEPVRPLPRPLDPPAPPPPLAVPASLAPRLLSQPDAAPRPPEVRLLQETRFDLDVQDADLRGLLVGLIRNSPFNAVVAPDVEGKVTADLSDVSLFDLLERMVAGRGYAYQVQGNTITIEPNPIETRTYAIEYPSYTRESTSDIEVYGAMGTSFSMTGASGGSSKDSSTSTSKTASTHDFWKEIDSSLRAIVGEVDPNAPGSRQVMVAPQSGLVLVRAEHGVQEQVRSFLAEMTRSSQRQVLIDARILEVTLGDDLDLGTDLEWAPNWRGDTTGAVARLIDPNHPVASVLTNLSPVLSNGGFTFGMASDRLSTRLRALAAQNDVRVVSTPRIATLNNHQALIKVVRNQVFFIAQNDVQTVEGVGTQVTTEFTPQVVPIGVTLDVTPRISGEGEITLHIHPSVSEVVAVQNQPTTIPGATGSLPVVDLRETDTVVRMGDGETMVIGGLIRSRELNQERRVPLLGDLPWLGLLFRNTHTEELRTELVILLTPRVLDAPRVSELASSSLDSLDRLNDLRVSRRLTRQWWRQPRNQSYGVP